MPSEQFSDYQNDVVELKIGLASAVKDIAINAKVIDKLAEAVEKIEIMNQNLCKMISLHELRHDTADKMQQDVDTEFKELTSRIDTLMAPKTDAKPTAQDEELRKTLTQFNKWKYMIMGGLVVVGYLLSNLQAFAAFILALIK